MVRTALEHRPGFNLGRRSDSEFGPKTRGTNSGLSAIGNWRSVSYRLFAQRWLFPVRPGALQQ